MEVDLKGFKPALWLLLVLGLLLLLIVLLLACRLYYLAKQSVAVKKVPKTTQATRRQWFLVGLCFIMMPCVIRSFGASYSTRSLHGSEMNGGAGTSHH
jgi:hypothetical protein